MVQQKAMICPHCGGDINQEMPQMVNGVLLYKGHQWQFAPTVAAMVEAYLHAMPGTVTDEQMAFLIWRGTKHEPIDARNTIAVMRYKARKALQQIGLDIQMTSFGVFKMVFGKASTKSRLALTDQQVARLLAQEGRPATAVASEMGITEQTVARYRKMHGQVPYHDRRRTRRKEGSV